VVRAELDMVRRPVALTDPLLDGEQTEQPSTTLTTSGGYPSAGAARRHLTYRQGIVRWRNYTGRSPDPGQDGQEAGAGQILGRAGESRRPSCRIDWSSTASAARYADGSRRSAQRYTVGAIPP